MERTMSFREEDQLEAVDLLQRGDETRGIPVESAAIAVVQISRVDADSNDAPLTRTGAP